MNGSVIAGLVILSIATLVLGAGFASGNMFVNLNINTDRRSAPAPFWAVAGMWMLMAIFGGMIVLVNLTK